MECVTVLILVAWEERYDLWLSTWQCWQNGIPTILQVHINALFQHQKDTVTFLQNTGMPPPASSVATQNTTVLEAMFIY